MAFNPTENFDSYSDGNNLNTLNGGSGWGGAWSESSAGRFKITNVSAQSGSLSVRHDSYGVNGIEPDASRSFDTTYSGGEEIQFYMKKVGSHTADLTFVALFKDTNRAMFVGFEQTSGNIIANHSGGNNTLVSGSTLDQWYKVTIEMGSSTYRIKIDSAAYSSALTYTNSVTTGVNKIQLRISANNNADYYFYVDSIGPVPASTSVKDIIGSGFIVFPRT